MSHFYGDLQGNRGMATRQGTRASGIDCHIRGWHTGARVIVDSDLLTGKDRVRVYMTGGSNAGVGPLIAEWTEDSKAPAFFK